MDLTQRTAYGGGIWDQVRRVQSFDEERTQGGTWRRAGYNTEYAPLREVILRMPGEEIANISDPDRVQFLEKPDLNALRREMEDLAAIYRSEGVTVHFIDGPADKPNLLFMRELFLATLGLTFVSRPATTIRAGEEIHVAEKLAQLGVPMHTVTSGTFEAADVVFVKPGRILFRHGNRSESHVLDEIVRNAGGRLSVVNTYRVPSGRSQHLLGLLNVVDRDLALVRELTPRPIVEDVKREVGGVLVLEENREVTRLLASNVVALAPRKILMPDDCPETRKRCEQHGIEVLVARTSEIRKGAGGLGCVTGILTREPQ